MKYDLALMTGVDIPVAQIQLAIHQPSIKEISMIGEEDFFSGLSCLCVNKNVIIQDKSLLETTTNFQVFMMIMQSSEETEKKRQSQLVLSLLFPGCNPSFTPRSILLMDNEKQMHIIDENNFDLIQDIIRDIFCFNHNSDGLPEKYNTIGRRGREIAEKLMRGRQRVAESKAKEKNNSSMLVQYLSVLTIGISSMSLKDVMELTMFQLYDLVERYSKYINWDLDIKSRLAGAKGEKDIEDWMGSIH